MSIADRDPTKPWCINGTKVGAYHDWEGQLHVPFQQDRTILIVSVPNQVEADQFEADDLLGAVADGLERLS